MNKIITTLIISALIFSMGCKKESTPAPAAPETPPVAIPTNTPTQVPGTSTSTSTPTHTNTRTNTHTSIWTYTYTSTPTIANTFTETNTRTHTNTFTSIYTLSPTRTHTPTRTSTNTYTPTYTHTMTSTPVGTVLVSGQTFNATSNIDVDIATSKVIFTGHGILATVPTSGGTATTISYACSYDFENDGNNVYFGAYNSCVLYKIPLVGGSSTLLDSVPEVVQIESDTSNVYYIDNDYMDNYITYQRMVRISKGGGTPTSLGYIGLKSESSISGMVMTSGKLLFDFTNTGIVKTISITGGTITNIISGLNQPWGMATDGAVAFVAEMGYGGILRFNDDGSNQTYIATGLVSPKYLWYDEATMYVYFSDPGANRIGKVLSNGGPVTYIRTGLSNPGPLATDSTYVYWMDISQGCIYRYPK